MDLKRRCLIPVRFCAARLFLLRYMFQSLHRTVPLHRTMSTYSRLVRFQPKASSTPLIGQPRDPKLDVGLASYAGDTIEVDVFSGKSVLAPGQPTGETAVVETLLSPLAAHEVGTIRCIGLNVSTTMKMNLL